MERQLLQPKDKPAAILDEPVVVDEAKPDIRQQPNTLSLDNINGRLTELADQNQILTARLVEMRGKMADYQRQLKDQAQVVLRLTTENEQLRGKGVLRHKGNGRQR